MAYKFSPSSLSLLKECPRCFWLQFNKDIKRPAKQFREEINILFDALIQKAFNGELTW